MKTIKEDYAFVKRVILSSGDVHFSTCINLISAFYRKCATSSKNKTLAKKLAYKLQLLLWNNKHDDE